jgi:hypothetical protein
MDLISLCNIYLLLLLLTFGLVFGFKYNYFITGSAKYFRVRKGSVAKLNCETPKQRMPKSTLPFRLATQKSRDEISFM